MRRRWNMSEAPFPITQRGSIGFAVKGLGKFLHRCPIARLRPKKVIGCNRGDEAFPGQAATFGAHGIYWSRPTRSSPGSWQVRPSWQRSAWESGPGLKDVHSSAKTSLPGPQRMTLVTVSSVRHQGADLCHEPCLPGLNTPPGVGALHVNWQLSLELCQF